jgi:hypothetical protein
MLKPPVTFGNKKLPKTTMIINITSATDCPSRKLGLCQLDHCGIGSNKCYALKFEKFRPCTLEHRRKQQAWWDQPAGDMLVSFKLLRSKMRRKITAVRVGESGDFRDLSDVLKLVVLAAGNRDLTWYLYTARKDLFTDTRLRALPDNVVVNGSGWMADNGFYAVPKGEARPLLHKGDGTSKVGWCVGDCKKCRMCLKATGIAIYAREH